MVKLLLLFVSLLFAAPVFACEIDADCSCHGAEQWSNSCICKQPVCADIGGACGGSGGNCGDGAAPELPSGALIVLAVGAAGLIIWTRRRAKLRS